MLLSAAVGGSVVVFGDPFSSQETGKTRQNSVEFSVKVSGTLTPQEHKLSCPASESGLASLKLGTDYESYVLSCDKVANEEELKKEMSQTRNDGNSINTFTCKHSSGNEYQCQFQPAAKGLNKTLKKSLTGDSRKDSRELKLRPDDKG
ncbi:hypothetical protein MHLP_02675 [Candidatus Mycoplasma haematolamae str. Purdue]|uniref:Uncharacterized protein n=1 Tax=Mycoplasma haematolamae (strain Purdue) TaxID=1212765 RepID=I7BA04_MYCHA|nr:hypothetical protein [Candidatus Mycoplasma haematolamae]AFO52115.1 hypothetical protein MHLP_02675 [Candidatus Mycoplasma haematolamae str. Purdue]